jgi:inorganic pyrophosphatase/exopolyphosphatase
VYTLHMKHIVVTAGEKFTDIDAFACVVAYTELLVLESKTAESVLPGFLNYSVTPSLQDLGFEIKTKPSFQDYKSVVLDVSEPKHIALCAFEESIIEIYDHRYGFIEYWHEALGDHAHIEFVGACATLVWEQYKLRGFKKDISSRSAHALIMAIASNTLNFNANVTTERDINSFRELQNYCNLTPDFIEEYYIEQEKSVLLDPIESILGDTKIIDTPKVKVTMAQLELWEGKDFIPNNIKALKEVIIDFGEEWFVSVPSVKEKKNYLYTESLHIQELLSTTIGATFFGSYGTTSTLWLRKEIRKKFFEL